jgi:hypothetical protein
MNARVKVRFGLSIAVVLSAQGMRALAAHDSTSEKAAPIAQAMEWVRFEDPFEQAFTVDIPKGWNARGGMFRLGYSDERPMIDIASPDGLVNVRLGDVSVRTYELPGRFHMREGEVDDLGAQAQLAIARYRSGPEFAVAYSHARFFRACHNPIADSEDVDFVMQDYLPADASAKQITTGQIAYRCDTNQGTRITFAYARTSLCGRLWQAALVSFMAPQRRASLARTIALHCALSFRLGSAWIEYQKQMDAQGLRYQRARQQEHLYQLNQQVQEFDAKMRSRRDQVEAFRRQQNARSEQVESFTQALRGVTPTIDPMAGEAREAWTGPKSRYWVNGLGDVVNSDLQPSPAWRQLQPDPPN